ncbi:zinc finger MYM-type protein 1-like [Protopterus annectens]|uniref:zinc finger MYM-type protein 1-like n=1 Tax=Protopterus annectens TaxID=7888 RepID=UPI001CF9BE48|nr:zinc finger MYM-type protein 1-like [Protopterus annectens]
MKTLVSDVPLKTVILNELLDCMLTICREEIKKEIRTAKFVAVIVDETTNDAGLFQIAIVFRYVVNGQVLERFWGYFIPPGQTAELIAGVIREQLKEVVGDQHEKVIAQSYGGASVMSGIQHRVQAIIRDEFKYAYYVHCYAHQLNLVMQRATLHNTEARTFLVILGGIPAFFSRSVERQDALDNIVARSMPRMSGTLWNFNICTVNAVYENLELLSECFHYLYRCPTSSAATVQEAGGLMQTLDDDEFKFWLAVFHRIMPHVDILDRQLQCRTTDAATVEKDVHIFLNAVDCVRSDVNDLAEQYLQKENILSRRTLRPSASQPRHDTLLSAAEEVCDVIKFQATSLFQQTGYLQASQLLLPEKLSTFAREFPENLFTATIDNYPFLLRRRLRTQLGVLFRREEFAANGSAVKMLQFLVDTSLTSVFSEVYNVLLIITTTPMSTAEAERCFSTLKRIKTFLRSTVEQERINAFAMISIEKELMQSITNFNQRVVDLFAQNTDTQMDLIYK